MHGPWLLRVDFSAILPDLSSAARQWRDVSHLNHGLSKLLEEKVFAPSIFLHQFKWFLILGHQNLVGTQKALVTQQILEVAVVEGCRRDKVQEEEVLIASGLRAPRPELGSVGLIQGEVWLCVSCLVVQPLSEAYTSWISYGVTSCKN